MDMNIVYRELGVRFGMPLSEAQWAEYYRLMGGIQISRRPAEKMRLEPVPFHLRSPQGSIFVGADDDEAPFDFTLRMRRGWEDWKCVYTHHTKPAKPRQGRWMPNQFVARDRLPCRYDISGAPV